MTVKTIYGIPATSIKTVNGKPIANVKTRNGEAMPTGGGGAGFALVQQTTGGAGSSGAFPAPPTIGNLIVVLSYENHFSQLNGCTDTALNTYPIAQTTDGASSVMVGIAYTVVTNTHAANVVACTTNTLDVPFVQAFEWSGNHSAPLDDVEYGANYTTGSVTTSVAGALIYALNGGSSYGVDVVAASGWTALVNWKDGIRDAEYKVAAGAGAYAAGFVDNNGVDYNTALVMAAFKPA